MFQRHHNGLFFNQRSVKYPHDRRMNNFWVFFLVLLEYFILHVSCGSKPFCYFNDEPKIFFATEVMLLFSRPWQTKEFTFAHWRHYPSFFFLFQIENHISDIDNWVKVCFFNHPWKNTPFFPIKNTEKYPVEPFVTETNCNSKSKDINLSPFHFQRKREETHL